MLLCGLAGTVRLFVVDSFPGLPKEQSKINLYDREPTQYTCQKLLFQDVLGAIWGSHIYICFGRHRNVFCSPAWCRSSTKVAALDSCSVYQGCCPKELSMLMYMFTSNLGHDDLKLFFVGMCYGRPCWQVVACISWTGGKLVISCYFSIFIPHVWNPANHREYSQKDNALQSFCCEVWQKGVGICYARSTKTHWSWLE